MVSKQAYKDKTVECPVSAIINEATTTAIHSPPSPPVVFASSIEIGNNAHESASSNTKSGNDPFVNPVLLSVSDTNVKQTPAA